MKKFFGNHVGIVVQNNDPDGGGKVKVWVPHITATVYKKWVEDKSNKQFKFFGANINSILTQSLSSSDYGEFKQATSILEELKLILPWADVAAPLIGESTSGRFNAANNFANISDANFYSSFSQSTDSAASTPGKPGAFYEKLDNRLSDAFVNASDNINRPNPLAYQYVPSTYSNRAKGSFSVPAVGSHVWVFFREGNPIKPVYFATTFGDIDWNGIFEDGDYPGSFENKSVGATDINVETYRNKYVLNQKGGSIEINNSDLKETVKFTHYSGSFKEFNNQSNIELATKNDQKLVLNDQYETVRGFKNEYVGKDLDENIIRDKYKKIGQLNSDLFDQWKSIVGPIQDNKQLFEIQRTFANNVLDPTGNIVIKRNSIMQTQAGTFAPHPVLASTNLYSNPNDTAAYVPELLQAYDFNIAQSIIDGPEYIDFLSSPVIPKPIFSPGVTSDAARYSAESGTKWGIGGVGFSTSTQNGVWAPDPNKELIKTLIEANMQSLVNIESQLGTGGSEIIQIAKHKVETIGQSVNDFGSIRYDGAGKMLTNEVLIDQFGAYVNYKESPLVEYVHVQDLPGGNYTLNVCNRFNVMVGAGGVNIKSLGSTNITGTITNVTGEQINIGSENEINIDAKTINISAEILRLRNKNQRQVFVEDSLGVSKNVIIGGGLNVEGELFVQHVTAPTEYQVTEITKLFGKLLAGLSFNATINLPGVAAGQGTTSTNATVTLTTNSNDNLVQCYEHAHVFKNLPLTLHDTNLQVRTAAAAMNSGKVRVAASPRWHVKK
jgi:hypothetical protein